MKIEDYSDQVKPLVKKTLLLLASLPSVSFKQLCESISLDDDADTLEDDDTVSEEDILRWCSSLVRTKEVWISTEILTTEIEFAHFTVREYLDSLDTRPLELEYPQLRHYTLPPDGGHELRRCIYLRFLTMGNIEQSLQTYSLAQTIYNIVEEGQARETYWQAASNWSSRIGKGMIVGSKFHELAQKLLLYKTPNFCLWAVVFIVQLRSYELEKRGYRPASSELIPLAINTVLRPDFTTLHMAAALHMPEICQELLDNGSSPNLCSNFGPPLHYAVGGRSIFTETNYYPLVVTSHLHRCSTVDRLQTVRLLLSAGAKPKSEMHTPFRCNKTLFSFALSYPVSFCLNLQIIHLLVEAHVKIRDQDVLLLEKYFNSSLSFSDPQLAEISNQLPGFLKALSDGNEQDTPEFAIRQKTLDFIKKTRKNRPDHPKPDFPKNGSTEETLNYIISVINFNDKQEMEAFLATDASDLIRSRGLDPENPDYTALHLAVSRRSLQVLESLLAFGLDARAKARNGTTPIHLCDAPSSKEALLVLLRYAKTSLDRDSSGETIWHRAARKNAIDVVHVLLYGGEAEIALKMVSIEGKTPMCIAASNIFPGPSVLWQITSYCERNGILGRKDSHKYFRSSEGLLTILRDDGNNKLKDTFLKGTNLSSTPTGLRLLARCFQKAMEQGDRDACEKLFELGCPTEFDLGTVKPLTPFALSIWNNQERMVAWFCTKNAPISTVVMHPRLSLRCTALELALERPNLNDCLPLLIERYLGEGGDFSHMQFSILTIPILSCNQPGLLILLEQLEGKTFGPGESTYVTDELLSTAKTK
jgi:ankyrin repeat protein